MANRRKATPVTLTRTQRERLERLWFYYGNYGPQTTPGNHQFIQSLLEHGLDLRPLQTQRTPKSERPTLECERAVQAVLAADRGDTVEERQQAHVDYFLERIAYWRERRRDEATARTLAARDADHVYPLRSEEEGSEVFNYLCRLEQEQRPGNNLR
jgi:hypothetical protein